MFLGRIRRWEASIHAHWWEAIVTRCCDCKYDCCGQDGGVCGGIEIIQRPLFDSSSDHDPEPLQSSENMTLEFPAPR